jgi:hypothetical protein
VCLLCRITEGYQQVAILSKFRSGTTNTDGICLAVKYLMAYWHQIQAKKPSLQACRLSQKFSTHLIMFPLYAK